MFQIKSLQTEYQTNPVGITAERPRFSWQYEAGSLIVQKSFRILVASSEALLAAGTPDLWDSGIVCSDRMTGVEYGGKPLVSRQICYVGLETESASGQRAASGVQTFETALLSETDWKGRWVSIPVNFQGGTLYFRKKLEIPKKKIVRARAYVCGLGYHELSFNGRKVGDSVLNPGVTEYSKRVLYCVYDFKEYLRESDNVVGVEVGYGWFGSRKLLAQFYVDFEDGTTFEDHSDCCCGWWVSGSPVLDNSIYGGEVYDARIEENYGAGWCDAAFEPTWANGWMYTILTQPPEGKLEPQLLEPIKVGREYPEVSRRTVAKDDIVFDVGQNLAGWAKIRVRGVRGTRITLKFAEDLKADGRVNQLNLRSARCSDTYVLKGGGIETYAPRFTYHGFRYVEAVIEGTAEILELTAQHVHSAVEHVGNFECSNQILNRLHRNAVITEENNLYSIMTDCPQRDERFGWLNDLSSRIFQTVYNFRMDRFFPKFVRDITHSQNEDGAIADTVPYYTGGQPADVVCVSYLLFGLECFKQYGDRRVAQEEYPHFKAWADYLLTRQKDYIMDYYYYADWVSPAIYEDSKTDGIFVSSVFLFWHLQVMARLAEIVGNDADADRYARLAAESRAAVHARYFHPERHCYATGTQGENALALNLGIPPESERAEIAKFILSDVERRGWHSTCGNQGYRHLFYGLGEEGYADELIRMITNPEYPGWGYMIACGATTVWERWESEMQNEMHSFDHPMFGSYDAWFYHGLGGIRIEEDAEACDKLTIAPIAPKSLDFVDCSLDTVRGRVVSRWKRENGHVRYDVEIPPNTTAKVKVCGKISSVEGGVCEHRISENGREVLLCSGCYRIYARENS